MSEWGPFRIFVDGQCPVCRREADLLRWLDGGRGRIVIEDITREDFDPARYGLYREALVQEIHGVTWDGRILRGMAVFRKAHEVLGLGLLAAPTGWPAVRPIADAVYRVFTRNRHRLFGRIAGCDSRVCRHQ